MALITTALFRMVGGTDTASFSPSRNPDMNVKETTNYNGITVTQAYGGKIYTNERYGKQLEFELTYTNLSEADKGKLEAIINNSAVKGRKGAFQFSPDNGTTYYTVRFTDNSLEFTQTAYSIYSVSFKIRQEVA